VLLEELHLTDLPVVALVGARGGRRPLGSSSVGQAMP
jgi:hypothetical protein